ncbi:MAG TPA: hypothetical protein VFL80_04030 [Thermoanaerobaculia bacterium]|nr:hypothetical protein [Thermoanaerobaculia bacterium]
MRRQVAVSILMVLVALTASSAMAQLSGAIYTSESSKVDGAWPAVGVNCETVNSNVTYAEKKAVYLNGGPRNQSSSGISPDGSYYVQVTDPSGSRVLGTSGADRPVQVVNGRFLACYQLWDIVKSGQSGYTAKGYDDTPNNGGEYKVWISQTDNFINSTTKTDNFKVAIERSCTPPPPVTLTVANCSDDTINCSNGSLQSLTGGRTYFTGDEIRFDLAVGGSSANVSYAIISLEQTLINLFPSNPFGALCFLEEAYSLNSTHNGIDILPSSGPLSAGPVVVVAAGSGFVAAGGTLTVTYVAPEPGHYFINATATATDASCASSFETASCWPDAINPTLAISPSCPTSATPFVGDQLSVPVTLTSNAPLTGVTFVANGGTPISVSLSETSPGSGVYQGSSSVTLTAIDGPLTLNLSASGSYDPAGDSTAPYTVNAQDSSTPACITGRLPKLTVSSTCPASAPVAGQTLNVNVTLTSDAPLTEYSSLSVGLSGATCGAVTISDGVGSATCAVSDVNIGPYAFTLSGSGVFRGNNITAGVGSSSSPCPVLSLAVSKTANTSLDRTWTWKVSKSGTPALTVPPGQSGIANYVVDVTASTTDSNWAVGGTISITNPSNGPVTFSVTDSMTQSVTCPSLTVEALATINCTYSASLSGPIGGKNTATVSVGTRSFVGSADFDFASPTVNKINKTASLSDVFTCPVPLVCGNSGFSQTFDEVGGSIPYSVTIANPATRGLTCGRLTAVNTATLTDGNGAQTAGASTVVSSDRATCYTLTQGAWGSAGGAGTVALITSLTQNELTIGGASHSISVQASLNCGSYSEPTVLMQRLPAGGTPKALNSGNVRVCANGLTSKTGKFSNVLVGQTFALSLNGRNQPGLGSLPLYCSFTTTKGSFTIDPALAAAAGDVQGLLNIANAALNGSATGFSFSVINSAVDTINRAFDGGASVTSIGSCP